MAGHKIFVSYKYHDTLVQRFRNHSLLQWPTKVRDYVDEIEAYLEKHGEHIYKGESDGEDLSGHDEKYIERKLRDRIYDSSVTLLLISRGMKDGTPDKDQWIPWEISYSLKEMTRNDKTSHSNAIVAVALPDMHGYYEYHKFMDHFYIVKENMKNGYIKVVNWEDFMKDPTKYIEAAIQRKESTPPDEIIKSVYPGQYTQNEKTSGSFFPYSY